ncbi:hypothetical protein GCK72_011316 [Caenorhabditis remanei]|uniref:Uncharacterized protein n=1 Tax=Caenorhabditis remanei TaxID=31234 RepID=A0A6A5H863_CAERE|nr:hypothetical protein GCK72_011316 [Caenorhabditis remanei]KAF1763051.1 hypothetical protein GCK72_011316 [Caenorhabditis remanei]
MVTLVGSCLELIRYIHRILKVNEVKRRRNELLVGYAAVIILAMRSRYLQYYSGFDEETVSRLQLNALIYAGSIYSFLWFIPHDSPRQNTQRLSEFTKTHFILIVAHIYIVSAAIDIENWLQALAWIFSFESFQHIYEILMSQSPDPAPVVPDTTPNFRYRLDAKDLARNRAEPRAEEPKNREEENFGARIQAAWYPMGQCIGEDNQRYFDLLIQRFKNNATLSKIRNAVNKMEEKSRHRNQRNELLGLPNTWKDKHFLDDLAGVMASIK